MTASFENPVNENAYEKSIIELFQNMGYIHVYGPDVDDRNFKTPLYEKVLEKSLADINPKLPKAAIDEALFKIKNFENAALIQKNLSFTDYLQNGIPVR